jgi:drug/metabolite transporter (DMT)-like permease
MVAKLAFVEKVTKRTIGGAVSGCGGALLIEYQYPLENGPWPYVALMILGVCIATYSSLFPRIKRGCQSPTLLIRIGTYSVLIIFAGSMIWSLYPRSALKSEAFVVRALKWGVDEGGEGFSCMRY